MAISAVNTSNLVDGVDGDLDGANGLISNKIGNDTYLYVNALDDDALLVYRLATDGTATLVQTILDTDDANYLLDGSFFSTIVEIEGTQFLIATGLNDDGLTVFEIAGDGTLTYVSNFADTSITFLNSIYSEPLVVEIAGATFIYATGYLDHGITVFSMDAGGGLTVVDNIQDDATLNLFRAGEAKSVTIGASTFVLASSTFDNGVSVFEVSNDGTLTNVENVSRTDDLAFLMEASFSLETVQTGNLTFVYVSGFTSDSITIFEMASDGTLSFVDAIVDSGTLELNGAYVLKSVTIGDVTYLGATGYDDNGFTLFRVGQDGLLTEVFSVTEPVVTELNGASDFEVVELDGVPFLYIAGRFDNGVSVLQLNLPIAVDYNGSTYEMAETLQGAVAVAEAGSTITVVDETLYDEAAVETAYVVRDNITVDLGALPVASATFDLDGFAFNFTVEGTTNAKVIGSGASSETITTDKGDDVVFGYGGDDTIDGGNGDDTLKGGQGEDSIFGDLGEDQIYGGSDDDLLYGGDAGDDLFGGAGADLVKGGGGADSVEAGKGKDTVEGGAGDDDLLGEDGDDLLKGGKGTDEIFGGSGEDMLYGGANGDFLSGGDNSDQLYGGAAADTISGGSGADDLFAGAGNDILLGGDGGDSMVGGSGTDTLDGGGGADTINAGSGDDIIIGGDGNDRMTGGGGEDVFLFEIGHGTDRIFDFADDVDELDLDLVAFGFGSVVALVNTVGSQDGADAVLDFGADGKIIVENFTLNDLINDIV